MKRNKINQLSKKIVSALKEVSKDIEFKVGVDVEITHEPCIRCFAHIYRLRKILDEGKVDKNGNAKSNNQSLQDDDESVIEREPT